jgi:hypothetical protein
MGNVLAAESMWTRLSEPRFRASERLVHIEELRSAGEVGWGV